MEQGESRHNGRKGNRYLKRERSEGRKGKDTIKKKGKELALSSNLYTLVELFAL